MIVPAWIHVYMYTISIIETSAFRIGTYELRHLYGVDLHSNLLLQALYSVSMWATPALSWAVCPTWSALHHSLCLSYHTCWLCEHTILMYCLKTSWVLAKLPKRAWTGELHPISSASLFHNFTLSSCSLMSLLFPLVRLSTAFSFVSTRAVAVWMGTQTNKQTYKSKGPARYAVALFVSVGQGER